MSADIGRGAALLVASVLIILVPLGLKVDYFKHVADNELQLFLDKFSDEILIKKEITAEAFNELNEEVSRIMPGIRIDLIIGRKALWFEDDAESAEIDYDEILTGNELAAMLESECTIRLSVGDALSIVAYGGECGSLVSGQLMTGPKNAMKRFNSGGVVR